MRIRPSAFFASLIGAASLASVSQFLWPPVGYYVASDGHTLLGIALQLLNPVSYEIYDYPFGGWVFIFAFGFMTIWLLSIARSVLAYYEKSTVSISVLETRVTIDIQDTLGCDAIYKRHQTFHANRGDIKAYRLQFSADSDGGVLDRDSFFQESKLDDVVITENIVMRGSDRELTVMERFNRNLPTSFWATFLPNVVVYWLYKRELFSKTVVVRKGSIRYKNECNGRYCVMAVNASESPITAVEMTVLFPEGTEPVEDDIRCYLTHVNACDDVPLNRLTHDTDESIPVGKVGFRAKKRDLYHKSMQILWENKNAIGAPCGP